MIVDTVLDEGIIYNYLFPFVRIIAMFIAMPILGTKLVPLQIKIILALAVTIAVSSNSTNPFITNDIISVMILVIQQFIIGAFMGFLLQLFFQLFVVAGQIVAMQMGLGFASMMDPQNGVSVPALGQLYLMVVTLLYLIMDGHLFAIQTLQQSFNVIPISVLDINSINFLTVIKATTWMFASSVKIVLPAVISLLLVSITLGVMTKAAPQINIFSIGFPLTMILGVGILFLSIQIFLPQFYILIESAHGILTLWAVQDGA